VKTATLLLVASSLAIGGGGGYLLGAGRIDLHGVVRLVFIATEAETSPAQAAGTGPVVYYRHPDGEPKWSPSPAETSDGRDFLAVRASEDVSFADAPPADETASQRTGDQETAGVEKTGGGRTILYYRNPMGLPDVSKVPKKDSMGMDYIPVYEGESDGGSDVRVALGKLQRTGVKTAPATVEVLRQTVRAPGVVAFDDRRIRAVSMRADAFVEDVADVTSGSRVRKGDPLFRFYSKELATAASEFANVVSSGGDTAGSALRLRNLGASESLIEAIRRDRKVPTKMTFDAPTDGVVVERNAVPGAMAEPGDVLFRIADTSDVWVVADVPESQLRDIAVGAAATVEVAAHPGGHVTGTVELVYPEIRDQTRTAKVRIRVPNPDGLLLANMFGDVRIERGPSDPVLSVPNDAVVDTGTRRIVFVDKGEGRFEPRDVTLGARGPSRVQVKTGISEGDRVVVSANFLLDAESNLNSALNSLSAGDVQP